MTNKELIDALNALNDGVSRPVTILEREVCGIAATKIAAMELEIQYLAQGNLELQMRLDGQQANEYAFID